MYVRYKSQQSGFTIIELLVVVALIGLVASVVLVSLEQARAKARDTERRAELNQIQLALELYRNEHGTFQVSGGGYLGGGQGWLGYENGSTYGTAVTRVLYNEGFLPVPQTEDPSTSPGYMIYVCNNGQSYALYATLENPSASETSEATSACNGASAVGTYDKNYVRKNE